MEKNIISENKNTANPLSVGATIEGKIVARDRSSLFVDLGIYGTGIIYGKEFYSVKNMIKDLGVGEKIFAKIVELENDDGYRELSLKDATKEIGWKKLKDAKESGEVLNVKISGVNKGGLLTNINGIQAFLPVSQLSPDHYPRVEDADKQKILKELQKFIGKSFEVKILDLTPSENKLILSEKIKSEEKIKKILENYKKGDVVEGEITGIADFGAFIKFPMGDSKEDNNEIPQVEGLIHISELDWQLVENPSDVVKVGDTVKAQIIDISNNQVSLSLKSLKTNPWENIEKKFKKGDIINGKVIKFSPFGAFVEIMPKIRGLCHISEFISKEEMENSLKINETYDFQILLIELKEHRMSLRLASKEKA